MVFEHLRDCFCQEDGQESESFKEMGTNTTCLRIHSVNADSAVELSLDIQESMTVLDLKKNIQGLLGIEPRRQLLSLSRNDHIACDGLLYNVDVLVKHLGEKPTCCGCQAFHDTREEEQPQPYRMSKAHLEDEVRCKDCGQMPLPEKTCTNQRLGMFEALKRYPSLQLTEFTTLAPQQTAECCIIPHCEDRAITVCQLGQLLEFVKRCCHCWYDSWKTSPQFRQPVQVETINLYQLYDWVIRPAMYADRCSYCCLLQQFCSNLLPSSCNNSFPDFVLLIFSESIGHTASALAGWISSVRMC